jgi:hypothetical protein
MPQFDIITFFNQLFYFTIVFFCFYFFILGTVIPKISIVLKIRNKKLNKDNSIANLLKNESNCVLISYDDLFLKTTSNFINGSTSVFFYLNIMVNLRFNWIFSKNITQLKMGYIYLKSLVKLFINY